MAGITFRIEFKQVSRNLVRQHGDHFIIPVLSAVAMQYRIPHQCIISQIMISSASKTMRDQAPLLCAFPNASLTSRSISIHYDASMSGLIFPFPKDISPGIMKKSHIPLAASHSYPWVGLLLFFSS